MVRSTIISALALIGILAGSCDSRSDLYYYHYLTAEERHLLPEPMPARAHVTIERDSTRLFSDSVEVVSDIFFAIEDNTCHTIGNLQQHQFRYVSFSTPGAPLTFMWRHDNCSDTQPFKICECTDATYASHAVFAPFPEKMTTTDELYTISIDTAARHITVRQNDRLTDWDIRY